MFVILLFLCKYSVILNYLTCSKKHQEVCFGWKLWSSDFSRDETCTSPPPPIKKVFPTPPPKIDIILLRPVRDLRHRIVPSCTGLVLLYFRYCWERSDPVTRTKRCCLTASRTTRKKKKIMYAEFQTFSKRVIPPRVEGSIYTV